MILLVTALTKETYFSSPIFDYLPMQIQFNETAGAAKCDFSKLLTPLYSESCNSGVL